MTPPGFISIPGLPKDRPAFCAMIHVPALPGTPRFGGSLRNVLRRVSEEAALLAEVGADAVMIENMHDAPYLLREVGPEITAAMTAAGLAASREIGAVPLGVQVLAGANKEALAVAQACGASFIRAEGFVFAHVGDEGWHEACAGELLRYRKAIGAEGIAVLADIKKKHSSHAVTADVSIEETAHAAEFFGADGVVVTGTATGSPANSDEVKRVRMAVRVPLAVGSGITPQNAKEFACADLFIVGSWYKTGGFWANPIEPARLREMAGAIKSLTRE
ncbi:BtpA/SgcQ family protein [Candidatus Poribacteria bacterium]|nr:BtpA/SgcQ family protein [Candidatus Poribacteria bacterium]